MGAGASADDVELEAREDEAPPYVAPGEPEVVQPRRLNSLALSLETPRHCN